MHRLNEKMNVDIKSMNDGVSFEWLSYDDFLPDLKIIQQERPAVYRRTVECGGYDINGAYRWWGAKSYADVQHKITNGWPELRERLLKMMDGIELDLPQFPTASTVRRRKRFRGDQGDSLDMGRVWNGQLDTAWERPKRTEKQANSTKRITVAFDVTANAVVSNDMAMWRAALCTLLVDSLARAGRIFEIWVVDSTSNPFSFNNGRRPPRLWAAWCVKRTADPLVLDRLCAMVSVGFMRTAGFMAMGASELEPSAGFGGALGTGLPHTLRERQAAGEIVLRIGQCYTRRDVISEYARAWEEVESHTTAGEEDAA